MQGPGLAYMVASNKYLSFLVKHIEEDEVYNTSGVEDVIFINLQISHCFLRGAMVSKQ